MSRLPDREELQTLAQNLWEGQDSSQGPYGDFVFLLPAPDFHDRTNRWHNVSIDGRKWGGDTIIISLANFANRIIEIEFPQHVPEDRELLAYGLAAEVGQIILSEQVAKQAGN